MARIGIVSLLLILSLVAAFILFHFLDSYAKIEQQSLSLGGAAAGFFAIFLLLRNTYFKLHSTEREGQTDDLTQQIEELQAKLREALSSRLDNFAVPEGFDSELSPEFNFGFCYPNGWNFSRFPQNTLYGYAIDSSEPNSTFKRNVNVVVEKIDNPPTTNALEKFYTQTVQQATGILHSTTTDFSDSFLLNGRPAHRYLVRYTRPDGFRLALFQVLFF